MQATERFQVNNGTMVIYGEGSSWSIDRQSFEVRRKALDAAGGVKPDIESQNPQLPNDFSAVKSFDRERNTMQMAELATENAVGILDECQKVSCEKKIGKNSALSIAVLSLGSLGVVYGDIGTSPLYAIQTLFATVSPTKDNVIGGCSAVFWLLTLVVTFKYVMVVMRANNQGEGGVMALTALASESSHEFSKSWWKGIVITMGILGAAMFYADSILTPAISVLSALEGIAIATPALTGNTMPIGVALLVALFLIQRFGTGVVGKVFGPMIFVWFLTLTITGIQQIALEPSILQAFNPARATSFLVVQTNEDNLLPVVGSIVLAVTGAEALYADLGHFGPLPIKISWMLIAMPALSINYMGQGALIIRDPTAASNPFYMLFPERFVLPAVALSTIATIIASQAVISGTYSMSSQAMKLGYLPRLNICHTSKSKIGQIYIPTVNYILMVAVVVVTAAFGTSASLASAYGMSVTVTMLITTILTAVVGVRWCLKNGRNWLIPLLLVLMASIAALDVLLVISCGKKFVNGAWFPVMVAGALFLLMSTWIRGRALLHGAVCVEQPPLGPMLACLAEEPLQRTSRVAVYPVSGEANVVPPAMLLNLRHYKALHDPSLVVSVVFEESPYVLEDARAKTATLAPGFLSVTLRYGFKEHPDLPAAIQALCASGAVAGDPLAVSYFVSRPLVEPRAGSARLWAWSSDDMGVWRKWLFGAVHRNASSAVDFYSIPREQSIELGTTVFI